MQGSATEHFPLRAKILRRAPAAFKEFGAPLGAECRASAGTASAAVSSARGWHGEMKVPAACRGPQGKGDGKKDANVE